MFDREGTQLGEDVTITSHSYDVNFHDNFMDRGVPEIHFWNLDRDSTPTLIRLQNPPIVGFIGLSNFVGSKLKSWDQGSIEMLMNRLKGIIKEDIQYMLTYRRELYYYTDDRTKQEEDPYKYKHKVLMVKFKSFEALKHCKNLLNKPFTVNEELKQLNLKFYEDDISAIRKLLTFKNLRYSQWFNITGNEVPMNHEHRVSHRGTEDTFNREFICKWTTITPIDPDKTLSWATKPRICAIDIESYTPNHKQFTNALDPDHPFYMISVIYSRYKCPGSAKKYVIMTPECSEVPECDEIIKVNDEVDLCNGLVDLIRRLDPEIITGYNIYSYDFPYMNTRLGRKAQKWKRGGRLNRETEFYSKNWKSSGYGNNVICYPIWHGSVVVDLLTVVKRDFKYDMYTLDFVAKQILGQKEGKDKITAEQMFIIYENVKRTTNNYNSICAEIKEFVKGYPILSPITGFDDNFREFVNKFIESNESNASTDTINEVDQDLIEQLEVFENKYIEAIKDHNVAKDEMARVTRYCIKDSELCNRMFEKLHLWEALIEMSNVAGIPIADVTTKGQQGRCLSQIYDMCNQDSVQENRFLIHKRLMPKMHYSGGFVNEPIQGRHENIVALDFNSLYPSIMMAYNICYTTLVRPEDMNKYTDADAHTITVVQEEPISGPVKSSRGAGDSNIDDADFEPGEDEKENDDDELGENCEMTPEDQVYEFEHLSAEGFDQKIVDFINNKKKKVEKKKTKTVTYIYKFVKPHIREGIIPKLERKLIDSRKLIKKKLKAKEEYKEVITDLYKMIEVMIAESYISSTDDQLTGVLGQYLKKELSEEDKQLNLLQLFKKYTENKINDYINKDQVIRDIWDKINAKTIEKNQMQMLLDNAQDIYNTKTYDEKYIKVIEEYNLQIYKKLKSEFNFNVPGIEFCIEELTPKIQAYDSAKNIFLQFYDNLLLELKNSTGEHENLTALFREKNKELKVYLPSLENLIAPIVNAISKAIKLHKSDSKEHKALEKLKKDIASHISSIKYYLVVDENEKFVEEYKEKKNRYEKINKECIELSAIVSNITENNDDDDDYNSNQYVLEQLKTIQSYKHEMAKIEEFMRINKNRDKEPFDYYESELDKYLSIYDGGINKSYGKIGILSKEIENYETSIRFLSTYVQNSADDNLILFINTEYYNVETDIVVLDKQQLAVKVCANSLYGFLGVQENGMLPLIEGAMSVTSKGRELIGEVNKLAEEKGGVVVYNDTDSSMIDFHISDPKDCVKIGKQLADEISGTPDVKLRSGKIVPGMKAKFLDPLRIEFEKGGRIFCLRKKKYTMYTLKDDGTFELEKSGDKKLLKRGITIARRDNCIYMREIYTKILNAIMEGEDIHYTFKLIVDSVIKLLKGEVEPRKLVIIRGLGSNYKSDSAMMKVFSDELAKRGHPAQAGDRIEYVVVKTIEEMYGDPEPKTGYKMRSIEMYEDSLNTYMRRKRGEFVKIDPYAYPYELIDYHWYVEHAIQNPIDQLFSIGYKKELKYAGLIGKSYRAGKKTSIVTPIKMMMKMFTHSIKLMGGDNDNLSNKYGNLSSKYAKICEEYVELPEMLKVGLENLPQEVEKLRIAYRQYFDERKLQIKRVQQIMAKKSRFQESEPTQNPINETSTVTTKETRRSRFQDDDVASVTSETYTIKSGTNSVISCAKSTTSNTKSTTSNTKSTCSIPKINRITPPSIVRNKSS